MIFFCRVAPKYQSASKFYVFLKFSIMLDDMRGEYIEICPIELRKQMREKGLTHADLAMKLKVSTRSVQRWLNQSVKRMKFENFRNLVMVLEVAPAVISKQKTVLRSQANNKLFDKLCSEHLLHQVHVNNDWNRYASLLRSFGGPRGAFISQSWIKHDVFGKDEGKRV